MDNVFQLLGISRDASVEELKACYRQQVKRCHPDMFSDPDEQHIAQEKLISLNLAYEKALKAIESRSLASSTIPAFDAKRTAKLMLSRNEPESALRQLMKSDSKDAEWYELKGILMQMLKQYEAAHQSFREAVRLAPDNRKYRELALEAALAMKKHKKLPFKLLDKMALSLKKIGLFD